MQLSFLQSKEWEELQESIGRKTWRINGALLLKHDLPFGFNYLYCPRPDFSDKQQETRDKFLDKVGEIAKTGKSIFLKIDSVENLNLSLATCRLSPSLQPRNTIILDIKKSEEELLREMHEKTRYNIRLAERRGVKVGGENRPSAFKEFWKLLEETAGRDSFYTHERQYYRKLLRAQSENFSNELFFAEYQGEILAAAIINFYGNVATYLHGASSRKNKEMMAPHLLHWRIIQEAKKRGLGQYDFWGVDEKKWPGVTRFKEGFSGDIVEYPLSVDIIYRPILYKIYRLARKLRRQSLMSKL